MSDSATIACVTGASGMIGRRVVTRLLDAGQTVRVLTRSGWDGDPRVTAFRGDLLDETALERFTAGAASVFHCAAELRDRARMWATNVEGTACLLEQAERAGVRRFCHLSSVGVFGRAAAGLVTEGTGCAPENEYERSKLASERLALNSDRMDVVVVLRPTNVVAPEKPGALGLAIRALPRDRLKTFIQGRERVHIVHAENVAAAAIHAMASASQTRLIYIVSNDDDVRNTLAGVWTLVRGHRPVALPRIIPQAARRLLRGRGRIGDVRYSSARLVASGFAMPFDLGATVRDVVRAVRV